MLLSVSLNLEVPSYSSYGVTNSVVIQYSNTGTTDAAAPVLVLSADKANLWLPNDPAISGSSIQLLATNPDPNGPAGTLAPGASGSIVVDFTSTTSTFYYPINFSLGQLTPGQTIDWSSIESSMRPSYINSTAWNAVFSNFTASVGSTTDSYQAALDADATYLAQLGEPSNDVADLVVYEINKADNSFSTPPLGGTVDISVPTPGPDLSFARSFQPTISGHNQAGLAGLGWTSNWDVRASTDSQGNVTISAGGGLRYFGLQGDGSYLPTLGDTGTLTALSGGGYQLTEIDGSLTAFNVNGTLNYVQDSNGNRITAAYNSSGQMVKLTESDGAALTIAYNSQGFISKITDPSGETASYTYDSAGHLLSVTTLQGTTKYSYVTGTGTGADNALQTILNPDGTQLNYTYDNEGRLTGSFYGTAANPIEPVTVSYLSPGGVTYTDTNGNKTTVLYTDLGQAAVITDPLGNTTRLSYDPSGDLTGAVLPGGTTYSYIYDLKGNLLSETDGLGNTTKFTYDAKGNLTSYTDAKGNTTSYAYDSNDDLLSATYANGAKQSYSYNPLGEATQFVNARGQAIGYSYNVQGQITKENFANGTSYSYTYDVHGNLTSATDAQGRVTKLIYGGDPNNPNNPDLLTEVEYPDGTYLKFSYYAGGNRKQSVDQTGFTVNYTYDAVGNLTELTDGNGNVIVQYTYDAAGNLIQKDNSNGTRTVYTYDAFDNVLSITNLAPDHTTVNSFDKYTYDALGNVLTDTNQDGQWVYAYDADSQLVQAVFTPNSANPDGLTAQNIQYAYDAAGNRTSETVNGVTTTYVVNNVNEYTSSTTAGVTTSYQYDTDGNLIAQTAGSNTTNYTFNELSQLTGISSPGLTTSYFYDPLGNRVSQTVNGATTNFQIDPAGLGNVVAAFSGTGTYNNSGGLLAHYTYGLGLVSQVSALGAEGYYDFGLTGNTTGITNTVGSYVNKYSYLPFGQTMAIATALPNPFTFVGQAGVMENGSAFFMGLRNYDFGTGRFLSPDPLGVGGGLNLYAYAGNSAPNYIDPTALLPIRIMRLLYKTGTRIFVRYARDVPDAGRAIRKGYVTESTAADAKKIARYAGYGKDPIHDDPHPDHPNPKPHWHANPRRRGWGKAFYGTARNVAGLLTVQGVLELDFPNNAYASGAGEIIDFFNPLTLPKDILDTIDDVDEFLSGFAKPAATATTDINNSNETPLPTAPVNDDPININLAPGPNGQLQYSGPIASAQNLDPSTPITAFQVYSSDDSDPYDDGNPSDDIFGLEVSNVQLVAVLGDLYNVIADILFPPNTQPGSYEIASQVQGDWVLSNFSYDPNQPQYTSIAYGGDIQAGSNTAVDPPLAIIDTTDPSITSASQVTVTTEKPYESNAPIPIPLVTGTTLTKLPNGMTQIVVNGTVSAVQPGTGSVVASLLDITLGKEPTMRTQLIVNETSSAYTVNPATVQVNRGQPVRNVQVATVAGPANGSYSATINWGDGDTSTGQLTALGGGLFSVTGTKPHPYATAGTDIITVTVNGPGTTPASPAQTTATVVANQPPAITSGNSAVFTAGQSGSFTVIATGFPTPTLSESGTLPSGVTFTDNGNGTATLGGTPAAGTNGTYYFTITAHNGAGSDATQSFTLTVNPPPPPPSPPPPVPPPPPPPPALKVPLLLAFFDALLGGTETVNANGTETITDSFFGIPLLVSTFDSSGDLLIVTLFGINVTVLFELL